MKPLLFLTLALSLLFNVFFAAGYVRARFEAENPKGNTIDAVTQALDLDPQQREQFQSLYRKATDERGQIDQQIAAAFQSLQNELATGEPDADSLRGALGTLVELRQERHTVGQPMLETFLGVLNPEQLHRLKHHMERGDRGRRMRERFLEMFDTNGDGTLDETERKTFQEYRSAMGEKRRNRQLLQRFDVDGDGTLNDEEQAARDAAIEQMRSQQQDYRAALERLTAEYDVDGDGTLSREERQTLEQRLEEEGFRRPQRRRSGGDRRSPPHGDRRERTGPRPGSGPGPDRE